MTARLAAALTASASRGLAIVTRPAPARKAPRAASRAAPVDHEGPETTTAWPRSYLCPASRGTGKCARQSAGTFSNVFGAICASTESGNADVGDRDRAAMKSAGQKQMPGLLAKKGDRLRGLHGNPHHRAGRAVDPARQIHGDDRRRLARSCSRSWRAAAPRPAGRARRRTAHRSRHRSRRRSRFADGPVRPAAPQRPGRSTFAPPSAASPLSRLASPTSNTCTR